TTPVGQRSMIAQSFDVIDGFIFYAIEKHIVGGVGSATENKILPNKDTPFIGLTVELLILVNSTPPNANKVHVCSFNMVEHLFVVCTILLCGKYFAGNGIGSLGK